MKVKVLKRVILFIAVMAFIGCGSNGGNKGNGGKGGGSNSSELPTTVVDALNASKSNLTPDLKDSITYMYSEEKLAREVYLNVYDKQPQKQLQNIATKSEIKHEDAVNKLAIKYDLNTTIYPDTPTPYDATSLEIFGSGKFPVVEIQELYDLLYDKGINSAQDALEIGCMVEVTDVDDLNKYLTQAKVSNADDVVVIFDYLRSGSYNHYWAFDKGLKNMGISDGCCSLGTSFCHPEYPQDNGDEGGN